jgi:hypothetical protein
MSSVPAVATASTDQQKQHLGEVVKKLHGLIKKLPSTLPCGTKDGPIAKHFTERGYDTEEGPYYTFNKSWERVFQAQDFRIEHIVIRGKYGLDLVYSYVVHFSGIPKIEENNGLQLMALRVEALIAMIDKL